MSRRLTVLLVAAFGALLAAGSTRAQAPVQRVGVVLFGGPYAQAVEGLREGLRELGMEEGRQYALLIRDAQGDLKAAGEAAKELEREKVDLIFALGSSVAFTAMKATERVPIVFHAGADPVKIGLVENYRKPGGRLTGVSSQTRDMAPKRLELLRDILPNAHKVLTFYNPNNPTGHDPTALREAGKNLKLQIIERWVKSGDELRAALVALKPGEVDAILYVGDAMVISQSQALIAAGLAKRIPTLVQEEGSVALGALASYGVSFRAAGRLAAKHVQRILTGARPGDLPVERLDRLHLAVNLKTAKAIGVTIPKAVLDRADEIIQ